MPDLQSDIRPCPNRHPIGNSVSTNQDVLVNPHPVSDVSGAVLHRSVKHLVGSLLWRQPRDTSIGAAVVHDRKRSKITRKCAQCFLVTSLIIAVLFLWMLSSRTRKDEQDSTFGSQFTFLQPILRPRSSPQRKTNHDPETWLRENIARHYRGQHEATRGSSRPRAAIISLVRNEELEGILQSMRELEARWNHWYNYPWIFFNEQSFSQEFMAATSNMTSAVTFYEVVPREHWSTPSWIDEETYMDSLDYLGIINVGKGWMLSYRNMCRWNSGFFYKHPALKDYDYYWRIEPDVHFFCDIPYDPFRFLRDNGLVYGFNMNILDDARSFASLWRTTKNFMALRPDLVHEHADLDWLVDPDNAGEYNNCQFFSNFEIGSLNFFRAEANEAYFRYLDESGGFYYERFGDAPVHTLSVALFAPKDKTWFFRDIGYQHDIAAHCPADGVVSGRCSCEPTGLDENFYKLVPMESPQKKPRNTCIRQWLGGDWLEKQDGWTQEAELAFGGDGYGGYIKKVLESSSSGQ